VTKKVGRPSLYSEELADSICEQIVTGKSLVSILKQEGMPSYTQVMKWLDTKEEFADKYARAKAAQADYLADELMEIADNDSLDIGFTDDGKPFVKGENIQRSRLRVDTRKWIASKLKPKKYGDYQKREVSGPNGGPVPVQNILDLSKVSSDHLRVLKDVAKELGDVAAEPGTDRSGVGETKPG